MVFPRFEGKLLITGGSGMVGRNILEHPFFAEGFASHQVLAPSRRELDLEDRAATLSYFHQHKPCYVIHSAGLVGGIQANLENPFEFLHRNIDVGFNVISAAIGVGTKRVINLASSCIYPSNFDRPLREDDLLTAALEPTNEGYALAKIVVAKFGQYCNVKGSPTKVKTLIPCNLYGRHDKFDPKHSHLIAAIVHKIHLAVRQANKTVTIWSDGEARREFMDAADLADFLALAVIRFDELPDLMNVGVGQDYTIIHYYRAVAEELGFVGEFTFDLTKPMGMRRKLLDVRMQRQFGWRPRSSLAEGIHKTCEFYRKSLAES